jgi:hypothetical protein
MITVEPKAHDLVLAVFWSKGSAKMQRYDKLGNRDLIDDSISTQKTRLVLFRSPGCSAEEKCSDCAGAED